ncbi:MAG: ArsR/SmtB family transcription factor [Phycisphaerales bacterium]
MARPYRTHDDERDVFRALAHPVRRRMIAASLDRSVSFDQLQQLTRRSRATVAAHLRILREARLFLATRDGKAVSYRTRRQTLRSCHKWLAEMVQAADQSSDVES